MRESPADGTREIKADRSDEVEDVQDDPSDDRDPCKIENHEKKESYSTLIVVH